MVLYLMPNNLEGITSVPYQLDVMDGKVAEKEKGWGCLDCHTMWEYVNRCDQNGAKVCKNCGERSPEQWMRVLVISDVDARGYFTDAED
jgi:RNA polymerase subunit RPABC4/transcription elongation factor Spt4